MKILPFFPKSNPPEVIQFPDKRLRVVCKQVVKIDKEFQKIASDLIKVMKKIDGTFKFWLGMAANQLGYDKRIIVLKKSIGDYRIMINPEIIEKKWPFLVLSACFSFRGLYIVPAYLLARVRYQNMKGELCEEVLKGGMAVVLQQEVDHINGKLICDL